MGLMSKRKSTVLPKGCMSTVLPKCRMSCMLPTEGMLPPCVEGMATKGWLRELSVSRLTQMATMDGTGVTVEAVRELRAGRGLVELGRSTRSEEGGVGVHLVWLGHDRRKGGKGDQKKPWNTILKRR